MNLANEVRPRLESLIKVGRDTGCAMIYGMLELMGKRQNITYGIATKAGFDFNVAVKIAFRKGTARIRGTRDGDSISGLITLPVGDVDFTGTRA